MVHDFPSAYDELIENSRRRIRLLEGMARALYREWFVHFRFPGNEKLPRVTSPIGDIPKGWEGRFGDLASIDRSLEGYLNELLRDDVVRCPAQSVEPEIRLFQRHCPEVTDGTGRNPSISVVIHPRPWRVRACRAARARQTERKNWLGSLP